MATQKEKILEAVSLMFDANGDGNSIMLNTYDGKTSQAKLRFENWDIHPPLPGLTAEKALSVLLDDDYEEADVAQVFEYSDDGCVVVHEYAYIKNGEHSGWSHKKSDVHDLVEFLLKDLQHSDDTIKFLEALGETTAEYLLSEGDTKISAEYVGQDEYRYFYEDLGEFYVADKVDLIDLGLALLREELGLNPDECCLDVGFDAWLSGNGYADDCQHEERCDEC